jgi:hypothetical protein
MIRLSLSEELVTASSHQTFRRIVSDDDPQSVQAFEKVSFHCRYSFGSCDCWRRAFQVV